MDAIQDVNIVAALRQILEHGFTHHVTLRKGNKSLADLMNEGLGETMKLCLISELRHRTKAMDSKVNIYMDAIEHLLEVEPSVHSDHIEDDREGRAMEMFVFEIINPVHNLFLYYRDECWEYPQRFHAAINRVFETADKKALGKISNKRFLKGMLFHLINGCGRTKSMALSMLVSVMDKLPSKFRKCLLKPLVVFKLKRIIDNPEELDGKLVDKVDQVFRKNGLRDRFIAFHPHWETIVRACRGLSDDNDHRDDCDHPIRVIAQLISNDQITCYEAIEIDLARVMTEFLYCNDREAVLDGNVRKFLSAFLEFNDQGQITGWTAFKNLVSFVIDNCYKIQESIRTWLTTCAIGCDDNECSFTNAKEHLIRLLKFLDYLYYLNENWYQWCNMATGSKLLDKNAFQHFPILMLVTHSMRIGEIEDCDLARTCSVPFPYTLRKELMTMTLAPRRKKRETMFLVSRETPLEDLYKIFVESGKIIEEKWGYAFQGELGRGPGPTKEFYSAISFEFLRQKYDLWEGSVEYLNDDTPEISLNNESKGYVISPNGLFPKLAENTKTPKPFYLLGKTMAKALLDGHMLDIPLSTEFFRKFICKRHDLDRQSYHDIPKALPVATQLVHQLLSVLNRKRVIESNHDITESEKETLINELTFDEGCSFDDLCVNFTVPGYQGINLVENGEDVLLSPENMELYLGRLNDIVLGRIKWQVGEFRRGFEEVIPLTPLEMFSTDELQRIFCGESSEVWTADYLNAFCSFKGFTTESRSVQILIEVLTSMDSREKRLFLKFVTGRSCLPFGGLKNLDPRLTIALMKTDPDQTDMRLPTSSTCFNLLFLPEYSSVEVTRKKLFYAIREGRDTFQII